MADLSSVDDCKVIQLPLYGSERKGNITPIYGSVHIPFDIARVYYVYDIPADSYRGGHAHHELQQLLVSICGSFEVELDDGTQKRTVALNRPSMGLLIPTMIWRELKTFSGGSICLCLASEHYNEIDYIRDYADFLKLRERR